MMLRARPYIPVIAAVSIILLLWHLPRFRDGNGPEISITHQPSAEPVSELSPGVPKPKGAVYSKTVVVARLESENVSWLEEANLDINRAIYVVDNPSLSPDFQIPQNKGHEAMVYLSYVIDHYDNLSDISIFVHAHQTTWHNNDLLNSDMIKTISHLSDAHVTRSGYFNLRCHHEPGCPDWLHLDRPDDELDTHRKMEERAFSLGVWKELHPGVPPPKAISQPCCAQFAVSRDRIRSIPKSEYVRYRDWILNTKLEDKFSGRVMEYSWQYLFAGVPELCPEMHMCYCDGYGICFGGATQFQKWFDMRTEMRTLHAGMNNLTDDPERESELNDMRAKTHEMDLQLQRLKNEALDRGHDPRLRALEVGRVWREGDGY